MNDGQPLIEKAEIDQSTPFAEMARKVMENATNGFGGALVIVPPEGNPVELLMVKAGSDPGMFWGLVKSLADQAMGDLEDAKRNQTQGWGGGRR